MVEEAEREKETALLVNINIPCKKCFRIVTTYHHLSASSNTFLLNLYEEIKNLDHEQQRAILGEGNTVRALHPVGGKNDLRLCLDALRTTIR